MSIVAAKTAFAGSGGVFVQGGALFAHDHPLVRRFPDMFEVPVFAGSDGETVVEAATAAPGERRSTKRTAKRTPDAS